VIAFGITIASCWAVLSSRILVRTRGDLPGSKRLGWIRVLAVIILFGLLASTLTFPFDVYRDFYREHLYGMANHDFKAWLGEESMRIVIGAILTGILFTMIYAVIQRAPRSWWIWGSGISVVFIAILLLLGPTYIDPLFNTYKALDDERIRQPILAMARADGVPVDNVYQFDASRQTDRISANVSGIFGVAAVRLNDNLLKRTSLPEIKGVMGHEIGHYVLNHVYKMLILVVLILGLGFAFLKWSLGAALRRWGERFGLRGQADPANLPLLMALFSFYIFVMTPVLNTASRVDEAEADAYGLNASQEPDGFAEVDLKLTEYRKADPGAFEEFFFYDHPSPRKRIFAAMRWKQEHWNRQEGGK
jgi:STE24 endopeptidase